MVIEEYSWAHFLDLVNLALVTSATEKTYNTCNHSNDYKNSGSMIGKLETIHEGVSFCFEEDEATSGYKSHNMIKHTCSYGILSFLLIDGDNDAWKEEQKLSENLYVTDSSFRGERFVINDSGFIEESMCNKNIEVAVNDIKERENSFKDFASLETKDYPPLVKEDFEIQDKDEEVLGCYYLFPYSFLGTITKYLMLMKNFFCI